MVQLDKSVLQTLISQVGNQQTGTQTQASNGIGNIFNTAPNAQQPLGTPGSAAPNQQALGELLGTIIGIAIFKKLIDKAKGKKDDKADVNTNDAPKEQKPSIIEVLQDKQKLDGLNQKYKIATNNGKHAVLGSGNEITLSNQNNTIVVSGQNNTITTNNRTNNYVLDGSEKDWSIKKTGAGEFTLSNSKTGNKININASESTTADMIMEKHVKFTTPLNDINSSIDNLATKQTVENGNHNVNADNSVVQINSKESDIGINSNGNRVVLGNGNNDVLIGGFNNKVSTQRGNNNYTLTGSEKDWNITRKDGAYYFTNQQTGNVLKIENDGDLDWIKSKIKYTVADMSVDSDIKNVAGVEEVDYKGNYQLNEAGKVVNFSAKEGNLSVGGYGNKAVISSNASKANINIGGNNNNVLVDNSYNNFVLEGNINDWKTSKNGDGEIYFKNEKTGNTVKFSNKQNRTIEEIMTSNIKFTQTTRDINQSLNNVAGVEEFNGQNVNTNSKAILLNKSKSNWNITGYNNKIEVDKNAYSSDINVAGQYNQVIVQDVNKLKSLTLDGNEKDWNVSKNKNGEYIYKNNYTGNEVRFASDTDADTIKQKLKFTPPPEVKQPEQPEQSQQPQQGYGQYNPYGNGYNPYAAYYANSQMQYQYQAQGPLTYSKVFDIQGGQLSAAQSNDYMMNFSVKPFEF